MRHLHSISMRQIIVACLVVVATGGLAGGFIWSQLSPNPIVASMSISGQTVSVTLPIGWSRAPGSGLKFTPMNAETATPHDVTMEALFYSPSRERRRRGSPRSLNEI